MKIIPAFFYLLVLVCETTTSLANLPEGPAEYAAWENESLQKIKASALDPADRAIPQLARWIQILSVESSPNWEKGDRPVFHTAQAALLAISGHAIYFERNIKAQKALLEQASNDEKWQLENTYRQVQTDGFRVLAQLPSLETVKVLGEFLSDEAGGFKPGPNDPPPTEGQAMSAQKKNCEQAAVALVKVIATSPVEDRGWRHPRDVEKWKAWYEKVKAGSLTFRLKGDPVEYDLNGPASAEKLREIEQGRREAESEARKDEGMKGVSVGIVVSGILVAAVAVWYFVRRGKKDV